MAKITEKPTVQVEITLKLSEEEARALHALTEYGEKNFFDFFYKFMGEAALKPYEAGLRSLFAGVKEYLPPIFAKIKAAREAFEKGRSN